MATILTVEGKLCERLIHGRPCGRPSSVRVGAAIYCERCDPSARTGAPRNVRVSYRYRDASNRNRNHAVVFEGPLDEAKAARLKAAFEEHSFIAPHAGLPDPRSLAERSASEHLVWLEFISVETTEDAATHGAFGDFVRTVEAARQDRTATAEGSGIGNEQQRR